MAQEVVWPFGQEVRASLTRYFNTGSSTFATPLKKKVPLLFVLRSSGRLNVWHRKIIRFYYSKSTASNVDCGYYKNQLDFGKAKVHSPEGRYDFSIIAGTQWVYVNMHMTLFKNPTGDRNCFFFFIMWVANVNRASTTETTICQWGIWAMVIGFLA